MGDFDTLYTSLDANEQRRGFEFEHVCKWFLENDPKYASLLTKVWLWKEWKQQWRSTEAGIDLVAEDVDGKLWAIQAKAYGENKPIPKRELDKFLSESNRAEFSYRLLITTTSEGLHHIAAETVSAQEKPVLIVGRSDLRDSPVDWPRSLADLRPAPPREPAQPRPHQDAAILDVLGGFESHDRGQLIMACGTGKTLTAWFINEKLSAQRTLVLVPSLSLLKQTMREWQCASGGAVPFTSMPVCSDASVSNNEDAGLAYTAELGVPAKTDPAEIAAFLRRKSGPLVVFSTYQSSPQIAKAFALGRVPAFDLVIADEAHRVAGPVSSDFATVLDDSRIKAKKRLFMTATPRVYSVAAKKASKEESFEYASMDDHDKFGEVLHELSFGSAIERKLLTKYQVVVIGVDDADYREMAERGVFVTRDGKTIDDARLLATHIGVAKAMKKHDLSRVISFHSLVSRARKFSTLLPEVIDWMPARERPEGVLWSGYVSGEMDAGKRSRLIRQLADLDGADRGLLSNARCLSEGVDVPTLDGVAFVDPKNSEVDIIQAVGRAIRKSDTKKTGTIIVPVFIGDGDDPEAALESGAFQAVWNVLRALRSHDGGLGHELDELRREIGRLGGKPQLPGKIRRELPQHVDKAFVDAFDVFLVEQTTPKWEFYYGVLQRYAAENGTTIVPARFRTVDGVGLGGWVDGQRQDYRKGELSDERIALLESVHPTWSWNPQDEQWEEGYRRFCEYVASTGSANISLKYVTPDGYRLGSWVNKQRGRYTAGAIDPERERRLSDIPGWVWNTLDAAWEYGYSRMVEHTAVTGSASVPGAYRTEDGFRLGGWVLEQRNAYAKGKLDPERQKRLDALDGWVWNARDAAWEAGFVHLSQHLAETGTTAVPQGFRAADGYQLGNWALNQRSFYRRGKLSPERIARLENLHHTWSWDPYASMWENGFDHLREFVEAEEHAHVTQSYMSPDGFKLGGWVLKQRTDFRTGKLDPVRQSRIEALHPTWTWDPKAAKRDEGFAHLERFILEEGHARVLSAYKTPCGFALGSWVGNLRSSHKKGALDQGVVRRLEAMHPSWSWNTKDGARDWQGPGATRGNDAPPHPWERPDGFTLFMQYVAENDSARVPQTYKTSDGFGLGSWLSTQRQLKRKGKLPADRQRLLENSHPTWTWEPHDDKWQEGYTNLLGYIAREDDALVPRDYVTHEGYRLGEWVKGQRADYSRGRLDDERCKLLEESHPTWTWRIREDGWENGIQRLSEYSAAHGGKIPLISYICSDGFRLGSWSNKQRSAFANGKMPEDRRKRLDKVRGWSWDPNEDKWVVGHGHLGAFFREHGNARPHRKYLSPDGYALGKWLEVQRVVHRRGKLSADRLERLNQFPDWM